MPVETSRAIDEIRNALLHDMNKSGRRYSNGSGLIRHARSSEGTRRIEQTIKDLQALQKPGEE